QRITDEGDRGQQRDGNPAGKRKSQGRETTAGVPSCSRVPSDTSGGWMPRPKYDSEGSAMMAPHTPIVASTIRSEDTFGTMWRVRIENVPTPENRAASTNSRSRSDFVWFFTICDMIIQLKPAIATTSTIHDMLDRSGETIIST